MEDMTKQQAAVLTILVLNTLAALIALALI